MQLVEARRLVGARLDLGRLATPYLAILLPVGLAVGSHLLHVDGHLDGRLATGVLALGSYVGILFLLGLDADDRMLLDPRRAARADAP